MTKPKPTPVGWVVLAVATVGAGLAVWAAQRRGGKS